MRKFGRKNRFYKMKISLCCSSGHGRMDGLRSPVDHRGEGGRTPCHCKTIGGAGETQGVLELGEVLINNLNFQMTNSGR